MKKLALLFGSLLISTTTFASGDFQVINTIYVNEVNFGANHYTDGVQDQQRAFNDLSPNIPCITQLNRELFELRSDSQIRQTMDGFATAAGNATSEASIDFYYIADKELITVGGRQRERLRPHRLFFRIRGGSSQDVRNGLAGSASFGITLNSNGTCNYERVFDLIRNQDINGPGQTSHQDDDTITEEGVLSEDLYLLNSENSQR